MIKYTEDDFKQKCDELSLTYVGTHKHAHKGSMIDFVCEKHKDKGIQSKDWSHFRLMKKGCSYCTGRNQTTEDVEKKIGRKEY